MLLNSVRGHFAIARISRVVHWLRIGGQGLTGRLHVAMRSHLGLRRANRHVTRLRRVSGLLRSVVGLVGGVSGLLLVCWRSVVALAAAVLLLPALQENEDDSDHGNSKH